MFESCTASESSSQKTSASALLSKVYKSLGHCVQFKAWDLSHRLGSARWRRSWIHLFHSVLSKAILLTAPGHPLSSPRRKQRLTPPGSLQLFFSASLSKCDITGAHVDTEFSNSCQRKDVPSPALLSEEAGLSHGGCTSLAGRQNPTLHRARRQTGS